MPITIERVWAMPNKHTFQIAPIKKLLEQEVDASELWLDPFANESKVATVTNDINPKYDTDYNLDSLGFLKLFADESVDGVLYDPPYSLRQVKECYDSIGRGFTQADATSFYHAHKAEIARVTRQGGKVISFGWNSGGIGKKYGFEIVKILLVPHGGARNDTICVVEVKTCDKRGEVL